MPVSLEQLVDACLQGTLILESEEMELVQMAEDEPAIYRGPGRVSQNSDGKFVVEMTATTVLNTDAIAAFNEALRAVSGEVLAEDRHFRLSFVDGSGRQWRAEDLYLHCSWNLAGAADPEFAAEIRVLRTEGPSLGAEHRVQVVFFEDMKLPHMPQSRTCVRTVLGTVNVHYESRRLDFALRSTDPRRDQFSFRLEEGLRFLTAGDPTPRVVINATPERSAWAFHSPLKRMGDSNMQMPIASNQIEYLNHGWQLFTRYLDYVITHGKPGFWHPLTYHLHNAGSVSGNSIESWAIGVSVATEGAANLVEMPPDPTEREAMRRFRRWLSGKIKAHEEFAPLAERVGSMLSGLGTPRAKDRLHHLAQKGAVTSAYVAAWGKLRNPHIHPRPPELNAAGQEEFQELIDRIFQVTTLLHEVAFHLIGYDGPYQDYGVRGFPVRQFRTTLEQAPDSA